MILSLIWLCILSYEPNSISWPNALTRSRYFRRLKTPKSTPPVAIPTIHGWRPEQTDYPRNLRWPDSLLSPRRGTAAGRTWKSIHSLGVRARPLLLRTATRGRLAAAHYLNRNCHQAIICPRDHLCTQMQATRRTQ